MTARHLDGNALAGMFYEVFGREMTDQEGCCDDCGAINPLGRTIVYRSGPGDVVRCADCGVVLMVAVKTPSHYRISIQSLRWIEVSG